jgi:peptidoglycan/LPS O-acetylase OafA/YrhL
MKRPQWLQDDIKLITQWWSTRFMGIGAIASLIGAGVACASPGYVFMDRLGKYGLPFLAILFICGILAQFYKQKKLRAPVSDPKDSVTK